VTAPALAGAQAALTAGFAGFTALALMVVAPLSRAPGRDHPAS
jgi:hypothetical protein